MIVGLGTDIVEIQRIADAVERWGDHFLSRIFTPAERAYCMERNRNPYPHLAARFAAKEAVIKALTPLRASGDSVLNLTDIEITNDVSGLPRIRVSGPFQDILAGHELHVSMSHEKQYATATVVLARNPCQAV